MGLPPVCDTLRAALEGQPKPEFGRDYGDILAASVSVVKNLIPGQDRKVRGAIRAGPVVYERDRARSLTSRLDVQMNPPAHTT